MQTPVPKTFTVRRLIGDGESLRGDLFTEVETDLGVVAFWGREGNLNNLTLIRQTRTPFTVTCGCVRPLGRYQSRHAIWVPERPPVKLLTTQPSAVTGSSKYPQVDMVAAQFEHLLDHFDRSGPFGGDQLRLHLKTIRRRRELGSVERAVTDDLFLTSLYATLKAWGIGQQASILSDFSHFAAELKRHRLALAALEKYTIDNLENVAAVTKSVWQLIESIQIVENKSKIVSGSKALHHLLPDLVVPMDRRYTQVFFGWNVYQWQHNPETCFSEAFEAFVSIARAATPRHFVGAGWRSSATKVIDNAIVAFVQASGKSGSPER